MTREQMIDESVRRFPNLLHRNRQSVLAGKGVLIYSQEAHNISQEFNRVVIEARRAA